MLKGDRKSVFHMALEQAQQLFSAAAQVGYESRPLLLFYGLNQAGRALAAASEHLRPNHPDPRRKAWQGTSHGLEFHTPLAQTQRFWESEIKVHPTARDSFSRASIALNSPCNVGAVPLGAIASQLPEFIYEFRDFSGWPKFLSLGNDLGFLHSGELGDSRDLPLRKYRGEHQPAAIYAWAAQFPALRGLVLRMDGAQLMLRENPSVPVLSVPSEQLLVTDSGAIHLRAAHRYRRSYVLSTRLGQAEEAVHPLLHWWLLLFSLSMLARYAPRDWTNTMDLTSSTVASQVEFLQDAALRSVPHLIAEALEHLNSDSR